MKKSVVAYSSIVIVLPLLALFLMEVIHRGGIGEVFSWITSKPTAFIAGYLLCFSILTTFVFLKRRLYVLSSLFLTIVMVIFAAISRVKFSLRSEPFIPADLKLGSEASGISEYLGDLGGVFTSSIVVGGIVALLLFIGLFIFMPETTIVFRKRLYMSILSLALFGLMFYSGKIVGVAFVSESFEENYNQNGFAVGFLLHEKENQETAKKHYSEKDIEKISAIINSESNKKTVQNGEKPNVIVIMSEAFWDVNALEGVTYTENPVPNFKALQENYSSGKLLSPVYGGNTANSEFEVITGLSVNLLPGGSIPYKSMIDRPIETIPSLLKENGYETSAIHTFHNWYYKRNKVYEYFGFDKFITMEFLANPELSKHYIKDEFVTNEILKQLKSSEKPDFVYAITMQGHGPYFGAEAATNTIFTQTEMDGTSKIVLEDYLNRTHQSDKELARLIEEVNKLDEPTMIVFFGDHLPMLGKEYSVYKELGFITDETNAEDYRKIHEAPYVIWDNFSDNREDKDMGVNFLHREILNRVGIGETQVSKYLGVLEEKGVYHSPQPSYYESFGLKEENMNGFNNLTHDILFGDQTVYTINDINLSRDPISFGQGEIVIESVEETKKHKYTASGTHFNSSSILYVNGKETKYELSDETSFTFSFKEKIKEIKLVTKDSQDSILKESNVYQNE